MWFNLVEFFAELFALGWVSLHKRTTQKVLLLCTKRSSTKYQTFFIKKCTNTAADDPKDTYSVYIVAFRLCSQACFEGAIGLTFKANKTVGFRSYFRHSATFQSQDRNEYSAQLRGENSVQLRQAHQEQQSMTSWGAPITHLSRRKKKVPCK
jgi:hypothetical protein